VDEVKSTCPLNTGQGALRVYQRRDGRYVVVHDEDGVTWVGNLTIVPRRTEFDRFEDALQSARDELEATVSGIAHQGLDEARDALAVAFGRFDFLLFHALGVLRP
jgi:hypothetical protein